MNSFGSLGVLHWLQLDKSIIWRKRMESYDGWTCRKHSNGNVCRTMWSTGIGILPVLTATLYAIICSYYDLYECTNTLPTLPGGVWEIPVWAMECLTLRVSSFPSGALLLRTGGLTCAHICGMCQTHLCQYVQHMWSYYVAVCAAKCEALLLLLLQLGAQTRTVSVSHISVIFRSLVNESLKTFDDMKQPQAQWHKCGFR